MRVKQSTLHNICCCLLMFVVWLCLSGLTPLICCTFFCPLASNLLIANQELHNPSIKTSTCAIDANRSIQTDQTQTPNCCKIKAKSSTHCQPSQVDKSDQPITQNSLSNNINKADLKFGAINNKSSNTKSSVLTDIPGMPMCCYTPLKESAENTYNNYKNVNLAAINQHEIELDIPVLIKQYSKLSNSAYQPDCSNTYLRCRVLLI